MIEEQWQRDHASPVFCFLQPDLTKRVDSKVGLNAEVVPRSLVHHAAGVVDNHMQGLVLRDQPLGVGLDAFGVGHVQVVHLHLGVARLLHNLLPRLFAALGIAADHVDNGAASRVLCCATEAETTVRASDKERAADREGESGRVEANENGHRRERSQVSVAHDERVEL